MGPGKYVRGPLQHGRPRDVHEAHPPMTAPYAHTFTLFMQGTQIQGANAVVTWTDDPTPVTLSVWNTLPLSATATSPEPVCTDDVEPDGDHYKGQCPQDGLPIASLTVGTSFILPDSGGGLGVLGALMFASQPTPGVPLLTDGVLVSTDNVTISFDHNWYYGAQKTTQFCVCRMFVTSK